MNCHRLPSIDLTAIRPYRGTQHGAFEELCVSLFRAQHGEPFSVVRIEGAGGDGGLEAYARNADGSVAGLQAKFFKTLGSTQWRQVKDSLEQAKKNYPALGLFYVAVPRALTPTQAQQWEKLRQLDAGLTSPVKLVWWGESEIIHLLTQPAHHGRATYWFGAAQFDDAWLDRHNEQARADLDTRYTPAQHVPVASEQTLQAFAHAPDFVAEYYERARVVWKKWRKSVDIAQGREPSLALQTAITAAKQVGADELPRLGDGRRLPPWPDIFDAIEKLRAAIAPIDRELEQLAEQAKAPPATAGEVPPSAKSREWIDNHRRDLSITTDQLYEFESFASDYRCVTHRFLLVLGQAGAGKSHLFATFVHAARQRNQCVLFLLGEYLTASTEPWRQVIDRLGWAGTVEDLLAAMNYAAEASGLPALIVIDALNESAHRDVWLRHLGAFANRLKPYGWLRLVVSCRSDFALITLPAAIAEARGPDWCVTRHRGFGEATFAAITRYFAAYRVQVRDFPPLLTEFENPLFLKTFSEAFENTEVPSGPLTLDRVMRRRIEVACQVIARAIDCPPDTTHAALDWLAEKISANQWQPIAQAEARRGIDALFPGHGQSRSLYQHLRSSGLVTEVGQRSATGTEIRVRFAYERFSDYFVASRLLKNITAATALKTAWRKMRYGAMWNDHAGYYQNRGLLRVLAILLPERFGIEAADLLNEPSIRRFVLEDFLASLAWRGAASITPQSQSLLREAQENFSIRTVLATLLRLAAIPAHPWNADFLHARLKPMPVARRDQIWTVPVSEMLRHNDGALPDLILQWLFDVPPKLLSDEQARLASRLLAWFFSSNDRGFRRRATLAAIRLLEGRAAITTALIENFHAINDPYVVERVYAVAAGVAVRERDATKLAPLAAAVWRTVFHPRYVPAHIRIRDYAFVILSTAQELGCLPRGVKEADFKPPYRSRWPKIWSQTKARSLDQNKGWWAIIESIEPEYGRGIGGYGDFGRYVMGAAMHHWTRVRRRRPYPNRGDKVGFDDLVARAWVLQRVVQLGWSPARFKKYEDTLLQGRQRTDVEETKQERIGKKYQWIALAELEARVSDHFHMAPGWNNEENRFEGAWQLFSRDFDPAQPLVDPFSTVEPDETEQARLRTLGWWVQYPDPFADPKLTRNRSAWVRTLPADFASMLQVPAGPGMPRPSLALCLWQSWDEPNPYPPRAPGDGVPHQFVHARAWIVSRNRLDHWLSFLRATHFWGDGVMLPSFSRAGLGEYPWARRFDDFREECANEDRFGRAFPPGLAYAACSYDDGEASLPSPQTMDLLQARWSGRDFEFTDASGALVACCPRVEKRTGTPPCLVDREKLIAVLAKQNQTLVWGMVGERICFDHDVSAHIADTAVTFSAVYWLDDRGALQGGLTRREVVMIPSDGNQQPYPRVMENFVENTAE